MNNFKKFLVEIINFSWKQGFKCEIRLVMFELELN